MGSFGEEPSGIDATVGGLVWVCRKNGSWWPGQIISPEDVPEGFMPASRVGTPIKLLGRDDVVEWHNLDKSKKVKAFRCGQFDYCIEKAKESSTTSHLVRKPIKYARREYAILEALNLERAHLDLLDQSAYPVKQNEPSLKQESEDSDDGSEDDSDSVQELSQPGVSFNEQDLVGTLKKESKRPIILNISDDDGSEGVKRMRGIKDLGMGVASKIKGKGSLKGTKDHELFKRKNRSRPLTKVMEASPPVVWKENESRDSDTYLVSRKISDCTAGVSSKNATSLADSMHGNDVTRKFNMLESRDGVTRPSLFNMRVGIAEKKNSAGSSEIITAPSSTSQPIPAFLSSQSSHIETISLGSEEPNDSNSTSSSTGTIPNISYTLSKTTNNWRVKGKRKSRSRMTVINDETETRARKSRSITEIQLAEIPGWSMNAHRKESSPTVQPAGDLSQRLLPYRHSRFTVNPKYESSDFPARHHVNRLGLYDVNIEVKASRRPQGVPYISLMSKLNGQPVKGNPVEIEVLADGFCDSFLALIRSDSSSSESDNDNDKVQQKKGTRGQLPAKPAPLAPVTKRETLLDSDYIDDKVHRKKGTRGRRPATPDPLALVTKRGSLMDLDYIDEKVHRKKETRGRPPATPNPLALASKRGPLLDLDYNDSKVQQRKGTREEQPTTLDPLALVTKRGTLRINNYPKFRKSSKSGILTTKKHNYPKFRKSSKTGLLTGKKKTKTGVSSKKTRKLSSLSSTSESEEEEEEEEKLIPVKVNPVVACVPLKVVFSRLNADLSNSMRFTGPRLS